MRHIVKSPVRKVRADERPTRRSDAGFDTKRDVVADETVEGVEVFATPVNVEQATFASDEVYDAASQQDDDAAPTLVFTDDEPIEEGITLTDLTLFSCRWPMGNPRDLTTFRYCGEAAPRAPYCNRHLRLAYLKRKT
jgi:hypothetical protein